MTRFFVCLAVILTILIGLVLYVAATPFRAIGSAMETVTQDSLASDK